MKATEPSSAIRGVYLRCDDLISDDHSFIWSSLVRHYGLPATPAWGSWVISQLQQQKRIQPLLGFGYGGVAVKAKRKELLALLRKGLRSN